MAMEEKKQTRFSKWLNHTDDKFEGKGFWKTVWQYIKFTVVSLFVTVIQLALVNLLYFFMKEWTEPLPGLLGDIFSESSVGVGHSNWGYILPFFLSNLIANTVGYILNKHKTFKSDAPIWHYVIYFVILILLITFSTWLQGVIVNAMIGASIEWLAPTIAAMTVGIMQGLILFPIQKFVLLREKKKEL